MYTTYKFSGFKERNIKNVKDDIIFLEYDMKRDTVYPKYIEIIVK